MADNEQQGQAQTTQPQPSQPVQTPIHVETADNSRLNKGDDSKPISTKDVKE